MTTSVISPLALTAGAGLYANTGLTINTVFSTNITAYNTTPFMANLLAAMDDAHNQPGVDITDAVMANLMSIGANVSGNYCPALGDSVPSNVSIPIGTSGYWGDSSIDSPFGLTGSLVKAANEYLGLGNYSVFCQAFATADAYVTVTNQIIFSADNANTYLGPTFRNMDDLITGDIARVNLATDAWGQDLQALGRLIDFNNLGQFGTPAGLLQQLSRVGNIINGTLPAVRNALFEEGLTDRDISDLVNNNIVGLFNPTGLSQRDFDRLQKRAYPALCTITGTNLTDVLTILGITTPNINSMCELLDPRRIFPNSYTSLTMPTPAGDVLIYSDSGNVNDIIADTLDAALVVPGGCENLAKIIPPDLAAANRALQLAFGQIKNISAVTLPELAQAVINLNTMRDLDLIANVATPIPTSAQSFYANTLATGSGPLGSILLTDVLGTPTGIGVNEYLEPVNDIIAASVTAGTLNNLGTIYSRMVSLFAGTYGTPPTITIPAGAGAGSYTTYSNALQALITAADAEIGTVITALGTDATTLNANWTAMAQHLEQELVLQSRAGINFDTDPGLGQTEITSFVTNLTAYGVNTQQGMSAQYLQSVANVATQAGQAIIATMREGRNNVLMDLATIGHDNAVPDTPSVPLPQADLGDATYTPAQARALVQARLSPG
jgi:hypothetical protein